MQSYPTHRRYLLPWHFIILPILGVNIVVQVVRLIQAPDTGTAWTAVLSVVLMGALVSARWMVLRVQDRIIRLEETLRLERLLPGRAHDVERLTIPQFIGIRFASDAEVPHLLDRILAGELESKDDIMRTVQHWRSDSLRV